MEESKQVPRAKREAKRVHLTAAFVASVKPPAPSMVTSRSGRAALRGEATYWDKNLPRFGLRVSWGGRKSWVITYRVHGRPRRLRLGRFPDFSLADARNVARERFGEVGRGIDPGAENAARRRAETFADLARLYLEKHALPRKRTGREDQCIIEKELLPAWGWRKARELRRADVIQVLDRITDRGVRRLDELAPRSLAWRQESSERGGAKCGPTAL